MTNEVQVYNAEDGYRWRYEYTNGNILADGGQGYSRRIDLVAALETLWRTAPVVVMPDGSTYRIAQPIAVQSALTLLTLITGDEWDENKLVNDAEALRATAKAVLRHKYGMTSADAETLVSERWEAYTGPIKPSQLGPEQPPPAAPDAPTRADIADRLRDYRKRRDMPTREPAPENEG